MTHQIPLKNVYQMEQAVQFYTGLLEFKILEAHRDNQENLVQVVIARGNNRIVIARQKSCEEGEKNSQICLLIKTDGN